MDVKDGAGAREADYLSRLERLHGSLCREAAEKVISWFKEQGFECEVTKSWDGMYLQLGRWNSRPLKLFLIWRERLGIHFSCLASLPAYQSVSARQQLHDRLKTFPGNSLRATGNLKGQPSFALKELLNSDLWREFQRVVLEIRDRIGQPPLA